MHGLKHLTALLDEIAAHQHLRSVDWEAIDIHLSRELARIASNHLCKTSVGVVEKRRRQRYRPHNEREKNNARRLLRDAVKRGTVAKPSECQACGRYTISYLLHGHHTDYSKPYSVKWLCVDCHGQEHSEIVQVKKLRQNPVGKLKSDDSPFYRRP